MSLIWPPAKATLGQVAFELGQQLVKQAGDAELSYGLAGRLYLSKSGWLMLSVPSSLIRGAFSALHEPGIELPLNDDGSLVGHVSIMRPSEVEKIGPDRITERGKILHYTLGPIKSVEPKSWNGVSRVWFITIRSPEAMALRRSYSLSSLPNDDWDLHATIAVRRVGVLHSNDVSKAATVISNKLAKPLDPSYDPKHPEENCPSCGANLERGDNGKCNRCLEDWPEKRAALVQHLLDKIAERRKTAEVSHVQELLKAKAFSDKRQFKRKHEILQALMKLAPDQYIVDQPRKKYPGITHLGSGFRIHSAPHLIPPGVKRGALKKEVPLQPQQQRLSEQAAVGPIRELLYHSLGSGKTRSALVGAETRGLPYTAVVPAALRMNFKGEQEKWLKDPLPSNVMSYNALAKAVPTDKTDTIIFDEAHRLRNQGARQTQNAEALAAKAQNVFLLSGSPIVNQPSDLAPMISMLTGKTMDPQTFTSRYVGQRRVWPGLMGWLRGVPTTKEPVLQRGNELKRLLRGKVDYYAPEKPDVKKEEERYTTEMSPQQTGLYRAFWGQLPWLLRWKVQHNYPMSNTEIKNLSSFLSGPRQVGLSTLPFMKGKRDPMQAFNESPKLQKAEGLLEGILGEKPTNKVVAFSNFLEAGLKPYDAALAAKHIPHAIFHGGLSDGERKKIIADYNSDKLRALLLSPAGGEGISLKGTTALQLLDPHWNEARSEQAIGRGIRFDSHLHLPPADRKVRIQRFASELPSGFWSRMWRRLTSTKPDNEHNNPGTDAYLERMAGRKSELNDQFLNLLKEVGSEGHKQATANYQPEQPGGSHYSPTALPANALGAGSLYAGGRVGLGAVGAHSRLQRNLQSYAQPGNTLQEIDNFVPQAGDILTYSDPINARPASGMDAWLGKARSLIGGNPYREHASVMIPNDAGVMKDVVPTALNPKATLPRLFGNLLLRDAEKGKSEWWSGKSFGERLTSPARYLYGTYRRASQLANRATNVMGLSPEKVTAGGNAFYVPDMRGVSEVFRPTSSLTAGETEKLVGNLASGSKHTIGGAEMVESGLRSLLNWPAKGPALNCAGGVCNAYAGIRNVGHAASLPEEIAHAKDFTRVLFNRASRLDPAALLQAGRRSVAVRAMLAAGLLGTGLAGLSRGWSRQPAKTAGASHYLNAFWQTPISYDRHHSPLRNLLNYLGRWKIQGQSNVSQSYGDQGVKFTLDPQARDAETLKNLGGQSSVLTHPLDRVMEGA